MITILSLELIKYIVCNLPITVKAHCNLSVIFYHSKVCSNSHYKSCYKAVLRCLSLIHGILIKLYMSPPGEENQIGPNMHFVQCLQMAQVIIRENIGPKFLSCEIASGNSMVFIKD